MTLNSVARRRHFCRNNCLNAVTSEMETAVATYAVGQAFENVHRLFWTRQIEKCGSLLPTVLLFKTRP
jgi:hypothetical protein